MFVCQRVISAWQRELAAAGLRLGGAEAEAKTGAEAAAGCRPVRWQRRRRGWTSFLDERAMLCGLQGGTAKAEAAAWIQAWRDSQKDVCQPAQSALPAAQTAAGAGVPSPQPAADRAGASHCIDEWRNEQSQMLGQAEQESGGSGQVLMQPCRGHSGPSWQDLLLCNL